MRNAHTLLDTDTFVMCATNEGALYNRYLELGQNNAGVDEWCCHILSVVLPHLSGPTGGYRGEKLAVYNLQECAEAMADYYNPHSDHFDTITRMAG